MARRYGIRMTVRLRINKFAVLLVSAAVYLVNLASARNSTATQRAELDPNHRRVLDLLNSVPLESHLSANFWSGGVTRRRTAEVQPQALRVRALFQLDDLEAGRANFLREVLIPATIDVLSAVAKVKRPVEGNLVLPRLCSTYYVAASGRRFPDRCGQVLPISTCGPFAREDPELYGPYQTCPYSFYDCNSGAGGSGLPDTDFVLYVTAVDSASCYDGTVATGGFCSLELDTGRPLAGFANFCPHGISTNRTDFGAQLDTAVHEILHGVVMSNELFPKYIDSEGQPYRNGPTSTGPTGHKTVITPRVRDVVRRHFDCPSAMGAPVEDDGGDGTISSHWESRYFENEIMQGASSRTNRQVLSKLTLALMADSGWYIPNMSAGGELAYGYKKGCGFLTESCALPTLPAIFDSYFCPVSVGEDMMIRTESVQDSCSWDHRSVSYCSASSRLTGNCRQVISYSNGLCSDPSNAAARRRSVEFGESWGQPNSRCLPLASPQVRIQSGRSVFTLSNSGAACWDVRCEPNDAGQSRVTVRVQGVDVVCPAGETVDLTALGTNIIEGVLGPCPEPEDVCPFIGCPNGCNGQGDCVGGKCQCYLGWSGWSCEHSECGINGGNNVCRYLHGENTLCNQDTGFCECVRGSACKLGSNLSKSSDTTTNIPPTPPPFSGVSPPSSSWTPVQLETRQPEYPPSAMNHQVPQPPGGPVPQSSSPPPTLDPQLATDILLEPVQSPTTSGKAIAFVGKAYGSGGFLQDCTVYIEGDGVPGRAALDQSGQTDTMGVFSMITPVLGPARVELPGGGSCRSSFTQIAPVLKLCAPAGFTILNPASTLAAAIMSNHAREVSAEAAQLMVVTGLGLPVSSRVFTHDIITEIAQGGERYRNNEAIEETAFVSMSNFATGVTVASAWLSRRSNALRERIEAADAVVNATAALIYQGTLVDFASQSSITAVLKTASENILPSSDTEASLTAAAICIAVFSRDRKSVV